MATKDARDMTVRELGELAERVRSAAVGSKELRRAADQMAIASVYLDDSGALAQLLWWSSHVEPESPPDAKAEVLEMPFC